MPFNRIRRVSRGLHACCTFVLVAAPPLILWAGFTLLRDPALLQATFPAWPIAAELPIFPRIAALLIGLLPFAVALWTVWQMRQLFGGYAQGQVFTQTAAQNILRIGWGAVIVALANILTHPVQAVLLTSANPPGEKLISVQFGSADIGFLLAGGLLLVIGWVLSAASDLAQDNAAII